MHAGLGYKVTPNVTFEMAYSYVNLGSAVTGANSAFDGRHRNREFPWTMNNITSNDFKMGIRWNSDNPGTVLPAAAGAKGLIDIRSS